MSFRIRIRRDTAANWTSADPVLALGEMGAETDTQRLKLGDGASTWSQLPYFTAMTPTSLLGSPSLITALGGISVADIPREYQFIAGNGGPVDITALNPQIEAGSVVGQELVLHGANNTNTVKIDNGNGLALNGPFTMKNTSQIYLMWNGSLWVEVSRNDVE